MHWALIFASLAIQSHTVFDWFCVSHAPQIELVRQCVALFRSSHFFELLSLDGALTYFFFSCSHEINKGISICVWPKGGQSLYAYLNCVSGACMFVCAIGIRQISRPSLIFSIRQWPMLIRRVHWKIICPYQRMGRSKKGKEQWVVFNEMISSQIALVSIATIRDRHAQNFANISSSLSSDA